MVYLALLDDSHGCDVRRSPTQSISHNPSKIPFGSLDLPDGTLGAQPW